MKHLLKLIFLLLLSASITSANQNYEPGVILLKIRQPNVVSIVDNQAINGSPELRTVFQKYGATGENWNYDIYLIDTATGITIQLTDDPTQERHPDVFMP